MKKILEKLGNFPEFSNKKYYINTWNSRLDTTKRIKLKMKSFIIALLVLSTYTQASDKIQITICFESLCPGCGQSIVQSFKPALSKGLLEMADVTYVPYGNADETKDGDKWKFECQHGSTECYGNALDSCILSHAKDNATALNAVTCIEEVANVAGKGFAKALKQCGETFSFDVEAVETCANGDEGNALQHQAAAATPDHDYVPWLIVDGQHPQENDEDQILDDVFTWACSNYKGDNKPAACTGKFLQKANKAIAFEGFCMNSVVSGLTQKMMTFDN